MERPVQDKAIKPDHDKAEQVEPEDRDPADNQPCSTVEITGTPDHLGRVQRGPIVTRPGLGRGR